MNDLSAPHVITQNQVHRARELDPGEAIRLEQRLKDTQCEILFSQSDCGRYATDASHYQIFPIGVVVPKTREDLRALIHIATEFDICLTGRGGGTSPKRQTINQSLVVDNSKYLNRLVEIDSENRTCIVEPGIVLDHLNSRLKPTGLWYPVDVSTSSSNAGRDGR